MLTFSKLLQLQQVSAGYVVDIFPSLARSATGLENPNFYEICPQLALGEHGLGFGMLGIYAEFPWASSGRQPPGGISKMSSIQILSRKQPLELRSAPTETLPKVE